MTTPAEHAQLTMAALNQHPGARALVEVTGLARRRIPVKQYYVDVPHAVDAAMELNAKGYNVFHSVNPRAAMSGFERDVAYAVALVLDLQPERSDIPGVVRRMTDHGIAPSIEAISGNGAHVYLLLDAPADPYSAKPVGERLCRATDSDRVFNINRILRTPGTVNLKPDKAPSWCYLTALNPERRYNLQQIEAAMDHMGVPSLRKVADAEPHQPENPTDDLRELLDRVSPHAYAIITSGEKNPFSEGQVTRSEADWFVVSELIRCDATDEQIHQIYAVYPIGYLKYREAGERYLNYTIESARRSTAQAERRNAYRRGPDAPKPARGGVADQRWRSGGRR